MKLTDVLTAKFAKLTKEGAAVDVACNIAGIHRATYYDWQKAGKAVADRLASGDVARSRLKKREKAVLAFHEQVNKASSEYELSLLKKIQARVPRWQALAWILERRFRERYARRVMLDTEAFLRRFEQEHGSALTAVLQKVLDAAEALTASNHTYDEADLQGDQLKKAAAE